MAEMTPEWDEELARLRAENARLVSLLDTHGIAWQLPVAAPTNATPLSTQEKVALFRRLFRGRTDVYPVLWESKAGKSGYSPACANEWRPGICEKPRIKCSDCGHRLLVPLTDQTIYDHLVGRHTVGVYPLLADDTCHFLAVDFDDADWRNDVQAFAGSCRELGVPVVLEVSRSGNGAHAWLFFSSNVPARDARRLGTAVISHTCARNRQLKLTSYDRLFPNQDTMPKGGFGNLIALPLQKIPRESGRSVFVNDTLQPYPDQWAFLASVQAIAPHDIEPTILRATEGSRPLDVTFITEEDKQEPWKRTTAAKRRLPGPMPKSLTAHLANLLYFDKEDLPQPLANRLIRLAAFQNPEFYKAQAMRLPIWDKPRVISCSEEFAQHLALPRGCLQEVSELLKEHGIRVVIRDERYAGKPIEVNFQGNLRDDQAEAIRQTLRHDEGVLCAPTAFGKTVLAAKLIADRAVNTLILVHREQLLEQWRARLAAFLDLPPKAIGQVIGGKDSRTGLIDVGLLQSLQRKGEVKDCVAEYGHVIADECHHLTAVSFEQGMRQVRAKGIYGLTATPTRKDGHHPIIFMQCGPIRFNMSAREAAERSPFQHLVLPRPTGFRMQPEGADRTIQDAYAALVTNEERNQQIVADIIQAVREGRTPLVLTNRTDHLERLASGLSEIQHVFILKGGMRKKERQAAVEELALIPDGVPRVLLATGS